MSLSPVNEACFLTFEPEMFTLVDNQMYSHRCTHCTEQTHASIYLNLYNAIVHPSLCSSSSTSTLPPVLSYHACGGAATLSGTSGFTSVTTLSNSSITLSPVLPPASLIFFNCSSASLSASSSAFLLPLVCCQRRTYQSMLSPIPV